MVVRMPSPSILFVANHFKTIFFWKIASRLEQDGYKVIWLSPSKVWTDWLKASSVPAERICTLDLREIEATRGARGHAWEAIGEVERKTGYRIMDLLQMDRILREGSPRQAEAYAAYVHLKLEDFLGEEQPLACFSEATWYHELYLAAWAESRGIPFADPQTTRLPYERFAFFKGLNNAEAFRGEPTLSLEEAGALADQVRNAMLMNAAQAEYKSYVHRFRHGIVSMDLPLRMLRKIIQSLLHARQDPSQKSVFHYLFNERKYLAPWRQFLNKLFQPFELPIASGSYILFTLHLQPESSIDVMGPQYSNQVDVIRRLRRILPSRYTLYIKEHFTDPGARPRKQIKELSKIPGVRLITPQLPILPLIMGASGIVTVAGTVGFEAGLLGRPCITLAPMFFGGLSSVRFAPMLESVPELLEELQQRTDTEDDWERQDRPFLAHFYQTSYPGIVSDPHSLPACIDPENVEQLHLGFKQMLTFIQQSRAFQATTAP